MKYLIVLILIGCNTKKEIISKVNQNNLKKFFIASVLNDSTISVDSFCIVRIDTITARNGYFFMSNTILDIVDENSSTLKMLELKIKEARQNYRLMSDNEYAVNLLKIYKEDFEMAQSKYKSLLFDDSLYLKDIERLDTLSAKCDTITPICLRAICAYQIKNKDFSINRDTAYIKLNTNYDIITKKEFMKYLPQFMPVSNVSFK